MTLDGLSSDILCLDSNPTGVELLPQLDGFLVCLSSVDLAPRELATIKVAIFAVANPTWESREVSDEKIEKPNTRR